MSARRNVAVVACTLTFAATAAVASPTMAQDGMQGMTMQGTSAPKPKPKSKQFPHGAHGKTGVPPAPASSASAAPATHGMDMQSMQHAGAPTPPRSPDYSDGIGYGTVIGMDMRDDAPLGMLLFDRLEYFDGRDGHGAAFDAQAWYGNDKNKLWLKAEGETGAGRLQDLRVEALWDRPVSAFWDMQAGVRHDAGIGPARNWAAFGIQGLAPYWFELQATVYVGPSRRTAFRFESEYELLLTQRWILQPRFEANLYSRGDPQRGIGSGLSDATLGLRLRYEITRRFAPYLGVEFERRFGETATLARSKGESAFDSRVVAGVRIWF